MQVRFLVRELRSHMLHGQELKTNEQNHKSKAYFLNGPLPKNSVVLSQVIECLLTLIHDSWLPLMFSKLGMNSAGPYPWKSMWPAPGCLFRELLCLLQPRMLQGNHQAWTTLFVHFYLGFQDYINHINLNPKFKWRHIFAYELSGEPFHCHQFSGCDPPGSFVLPGLLGFFFLVCIFIESVTL